MVKGFLWITNSDTITMVLIENDTNIAGYAAALIAEQKEIESFATGWEWKYYPLKNLVTKKHFYELFASWGFTAFIKEFCMEVITE